MGQQKAGPIIGGKAQLMLGPASGIADRGDDLTVTFAVAAMHENGCARFTKPLCDRAPHAIGRAGRLFRAGRSCCEPAYRLSPLTLAIASKRRGNATLEIASCSAARNHTRGLEHPPLRGQPPPLVNGNRPCD